MNLSTKIAACVLLSGVITAGSGCTSGRSAETGGGLVEILIKRCAQPTEPAEQRTDTERLIAAGADAAEESIHFATWQRGEFVGRQGGEEVRKLEDGHYVFVDGELQRVKFDPDA